MDLGDCDRGRAVPEGVAAVSEEESLVGEGVVGDGDKREREERECDDGTIFDVKAKKKRFVVEVLRDVEAKQKKSSYYGRRTRRYKRIRRRRRWR